MHIHLGALPLVLTFLGVVLVGIFWRLVGMWASVQSGVVASIGKAMLFAY